MTVVIPLLLIILSIAFCTSPSLSASKAEVASSKIKIFAFFIKAAIAILCFWPPLTLIPLSPTKVFKPLGNKLLSFINELTLLNFKTSSKSLFLYEDISYVIFSSIVPLFNIGSCETNPIFFLRKFIL